MRIKLNFRIYFVTIVKLPIRAADLRSDADLSRANLIDANLSGVKWDIFTHWIEALALADAIDVPEELKQHLGLD